MRPLATVRSIHTLFLASGWLLTATACGSDPGSIGAPTDGEPANENQNVDGGPGDASNLAVIAPRDTWTWVDVPEARCEDGSSTGFAINPSSTSNDLLFFMRGGGACWDYATCYTLRAATGGPYTKREFDAERAVFTRALFDREDPTNPFRSFSFVFVPYCTGDLHAGNNVATYRSGAMERQYHHVGHQNVLAYLERLVPTFVAPDRVVFSGSSAGGYGAVLNYATLRDAWPTAESFLIDDAGPILVGDDFAPSLRAAWSENWKLSETIPFCIDDCLADMSRIHWLLRARYQQDRFALLSSVQDRVIRSYLQQSGPDFETNLRQLATEVIEPVSDFEYFFIAGQTHTLLTSPATFRSNDTVLMNWLDEMVSGSGEWSSTSP